ncbi:hypothetical protein KSF_101980 [Reticulibacter mediterranei]|uniref:Uncharacterized protein n=1 Tax=Reticulibacter mediterranei TaxID=2778369 RepID=A0A8J3N928_9CHLR|nr:hypothetical protein KSF_101980 [Reticulibacter mediterranei]
MSRAFRKRKFRCSSRLICDANIFPDSVQYAACADWKDDKNRISLQTQQQERRPLMAIGKEQAVGEWGHH